MTFSINLGVWGSVFAVPACVVDKHIKLASEAQLKVLLYILRHAEDENSADTLCAALKLSREEAENALSFWVERGVLTESNGVLEPAKATEKAVSTEPVIPKPPEPVKKSHTTVSRARRPDSQFVAKLLKEDALLAGLLEEAQTVLKKPLSSGDTATLVMLYDTFGLPCEVIAMMMNYLASVGNANMRAVERLGIRWSDDGIKTAVDAEREIERLTNSREAWGRVSSLLGIRNIGKPTAAQMEHADRWLNEWGFNDEMITEAYERCVNTKGAYDIRYINAILKRWNNSGIKSLDTLHAQESATKNKTTVKKNNSSKGSVFSTDGASFDISQYENTSLFDD